MPFTLMSWNVQRLTENSRQYKWDVVNNHIQAVNPDLLGLIEIGANVAIPGYTLANFVNTLKSNDDESQLCIAAYLRNGAPLQLLGAKPLRAADTENQKRAQLKVNVLYGGAAYSIYLSHATASKGGGIDAVSGAVSELRINKKAICVGDLNYNLKLDASMLNILQNQQVQVLQATEMHGGNVKKTHKKGGILDFCLAGIQANVQAIPMAAYGNWKTIDHRPIAFTIQ